MEIMKLLIFYDSLTNNYSHSLICYYLPPWYYMVITSSMKLL